MNAMHLVGAGLACLVGSGMAAAQDPAASYPSKPVTIIVVVSAGGAAEAVVRTHTPKLGDNLGKPFVFDYKPGAGGTIGFATVAKAAPDGYTLLATPTAFSTVPALMSLPFDPFKDFAHVIRLATQAGLLVVNPSVPVNNLQEYIAYVKANPGKVNFGTMGVGTTAHLVGAWLNSLTGTQTTFIHYKGPQLSTDLVGGSVQATAGASSNLSPLVKGGKLRLLAIAGPVRSPAFPDVRTAREQGVDFDYPAWVGISAPGRTPPSIIAKLNAEFMKVQKLPETVQQLERIDNIPVGGTSAEFTRLIAEEIDRWKRIVKEADIKVES